jgi:hypothetical protein
MHKRVFPYSIAIAMAMASNPDFSLGSPVRRTSENEKRERERVHRLNPVDLSEREFTIKGERIMAHDRKTALKIYANRHPETKKKRRK